MSFADKLLDLLERFLKATLLMLSNALTEEGMAILWILMLVSMLAGVMFTSAISTLVSTVSTILGRLITYFLRSLSCFCRWIDCVLIRRLLCRMIWSESPILVKIAISAGLHVDIRNDDGETPFFRAVMSNNLKLAEMLFEAGADPQAYTFFETEVEEINLPAEIVEAQDLPDKTLVAITRQGVIMSYLETTEVLYTSLRWPTITVDRGRYRSSEVRFDKYNRVKLRKRWTEVKEKAIKNGVGQDTLKFLDEAIEVWEQRIEEEKDEIKAREWEKKQEWRKDDEEEEVEPEDKSPGFLSSLVQKFKGQKQEEKSGLDIASQARMEMAELEDRMRRNREAREPQG